MNDDPDLVEANHALLVLRQARLSKHAAAALMILDLAAQTAKDRFPRTPEFDDARAAATVAISALAETLNANPFAPPEMWKSTLRAVESWRELLK